MEYTDSRRGKPPRAVVSNGARALNFGVGLFFFTHLRGKAEAFSSCLVQHTAFIMLGWQPLAVKKGSIINVGVR